MSLLRLRLNRVRRRQTRGQALVELALIMPLLVGVLVVLLQFGILFVTHLSIVHMGRDVARWISVHPDVRDADPGSWTVTPWACDTSPTTISTTADRTESENDIIDYIRLNRPAVIAPTCVHLTTIDPLTNSTAWRNQVAGQPGVLWVYVLPTCAALDANNRCASRATSSEQRLTLAYDATNNLLPMFRIAWRFGPFFQIGPLPAVQIYDYRVMVERH
jgi:Flp pilus assembly protein TadG